VSDEMMFGIAKMPYEMAMGDEMSRRQFYANTQRLAAALEAARVDAARYRWLKKYAFCGVWARGDGIALVVPRAARADIDSKIDAARAALAVQGGN